MRTHTHKQLYQAGGGWWYSQDTHTRDPVQVHFTNNKIVKVKY